MPKSMGLFRPRRYRDADAALPGKHPRLSDEDVVQIRAMADAMTVPDLAYEFCTSTVHVWRILKRKARQDAEATP